MNIDFALILVVLTAVSGAVILFDRLVSRGRERDDEAPPNIVVDYARSFFPIFLVVLLLRSFLVEPFRIPSGSMIPTLLVGDFILVNKFEYGIRLPVINTKIVPLGEPERGDVVVFRNPENPSIPFIKRVVGVPGDTVEYRDKTVFVNGEKFDQTLVGGYVGTGRSTAHSSAVIYEETISENLEHEILITPVRPGSNGRTTVPEDAYFVLGDNRDNSRDSRFWGFVPDENLVGKAFVIWFNWDRGPKLSRIGTGIE